jgi:hypothetical protein
MHIDFVRVAVLGIATGNSRNRPGRQSALPAFQLAAAWVGPVLKGRIMCDPFDERAYGTFLNQWTADIHVKQDWVRRHPLDQTARQKLKDAGKLMVDATIDFIKRHSQFAIQRLNALKDVAAPNPFDDTREANLRNRLTIVAKGKDINLRDVVGIVNPILQAFREARAAYQIEVERLQQETVPIGRRRRKRGGKPRKPMPLTPRQTEVAQIMGECRGNVAEAARRLRRDRKTIEGTYRAAMGKLGKTAYLSKDKTRLLTRDRRGQYDVAEEDDKRRNIDNDDDE